MGYKFREEESLDYIPFTFSTVSRMSYEIIDMMLVGSLMLLVARDRLPFLQKIFVLRSMTRLPGQSLLI